MVGDSSVRNDARRTHGVPATAKVVAGTTGATQGRDNCGRRRQLLPGYRTARALVQEWARRAATTVSRRSIIDLIYSTPKYLARREYRGHQTVTRSFVVNLSAT